MAYRNDDFPIQLPDGSWAYSNADVTEKVIYGA